MPRAGAIIKNFGSPKKNRLINGGFRCAQRGTNIAITGGFTYQTLDRWQMAHNTGDKTSQNTSHGDAPSTIGTVPLPTRRGSFGTIEFTSTHTGPLGDLQARQFIENINVEDLAGGRASCGVQVKSDSADTVNLIIIDATVKNTFGGTILIDQEFTILNDGSWQFIDVKNLLMSANISNGCEVKVIFSNFLNTSGTRNHFVAEAMFNEGPVVAPFETFAVDETKEIIACQRYYEKSYGIDVPPGSINGVGAVEWSVVNYGVMNNLSFISETFQTAKRLNPVMVGYSLSNGTINRFSDSGGTDRVISFSSVGIKNFSWKHGDASSSTGMKYHYTAEAEI